jgi:antirestriction protein
MRAWIGCLASYNNGRLVGDWCDVSTDADENAAMIASALAKGTPGAEEHFIADYEGPKAVTYLLGEYASAAALAIAAAFEESAESLGDHAEPALDAYTDNVCPQRIDDLDSVDVADWWNDCYAGEGDTLADWAESYLEETGFLEGVPDDVARYFDFEAWARDMRLGGEIFTVSSASAGIIVLHSR